MEENIPINKSSVREEVKKLHKLKKLQEILDSQGLSELLFTLISQTSDLIVAANSIKLFNYLLIYSNETVRVKKSFLGSNESNGKVEGVQIKLPNVFIHKRSNEQRH